VKKAFVLLAAVVVLEGLLAIGVHAQGIPACYLVYQMYPYDPAFGLVIPGSACTDVPFMTLQNCWVATNKCTAICPTCPPGNPPPSGGAPINLATGDTYITQSDLSILGLAAGSVFRERGTASSHFMKPFQQVGSSEGIGDRLTRSSFLSTLGGWSSMCKEQGAFGLSVWIRLVRVVGRVGRALATP
jgi:hypothetical protein